MTRAWESFYIICAAIVLAKTLWHGPIPLEGRLKWSLDVTLEEVSIVLLARPWAEWGEHQT